MTIPVALIVVKFGGTSLADVNCFQNAAQIINYLLADNHKVVVVVSAINGETNRLAQMALELSETSQTSSAYDVVVSSGEQASSGLLALALESLQIKALPLQGWQVPILTSNDAGKAQVTSIPPQTLQSALENGYVPIVSGFQGVTENGVITTFGRGGSDVTAVLIAAALNADECRLYKDVDGILSADPKVVNTPHIIDTIGISDLWEQCSQGAKVIHPRAVQAALQHDVPLKITPTFAYKESNHVTGTSVVPLSQTMESSSVSGIVCNQNEVRFLIPSFETGSGIMNTLFKALAEKKIAVDMVLLDQAKNNGKLENNLSFTVPKSDASTTSDVLESIFPSQVSSAIECQKRIAKVAVIGSGMKAHADIISRVYKTISDLGINIFGLTASEIKINILVSQNYAKACAQALHDEFFLTKR